MNSTLYDLLEKSVSKNASKTAIFNNSTSLSYAQLLARVAHYAKLLSKHQLTRLGIYADNSSEWIAIDLACLKLEIPLVPIPYFFSLQQKKHILVDSCVDGLVAPQCGSLPWQLDTRNSVAIGFGLALYRIGDTENSPIDGSQIRSGLPHDTAKISYTSGSTGTPKGVCLPNQLLLQTSLALVDALQSVDARRHLSVLPFTTLLENVAGIYLPLLLGASINALSAHRLGMQPSLQVDPGVFAKAVNLTRPHSMIVTPQLLQLICVLASKGLIDTQDFKFIAVGGATCSKLLLERAGDLGLPVYQGYGLTECGSVVSLSTPERNLPGAAGKQLGHVKINIDELGLVQVETGALGRYLHDTGSFPQSIDTGDIGYLDAQGYLHLQGRKKNLIVLSNGRNITPEWIEGELEQQPEIAQGLVYGDGAEAAMALIVPSKESITEAALDQAVLLANLRLPAYAQIDGWRLARPFSLANGHLTANGKLRREQILTAYHLNQIKQQVCTVPDSSQQINPA